MGSLEMVGVVVPQLAQRSAQQNRQGSTQNSPPLAWKSNLGYFLPLLGTNQMCLTPYIHLDNTLKLSLGIEWTSEPLKVDQLMEKQERDAESFRAMYNAFAAENHKLAAA